MDRDSGGHTSIYSGYWPRSLTMDRGVVLSGTLPTSRPLRWAIQRMKKTISPYRILIMTRQRILIRRAAEERHLHIYALHRSAAVAVFNPPLIATPSSSSDSYFLSSHHHLHHHQQTASANEATDATARALGRSPTTHRARSPLICPRALQQCLQYPRRRRRRRCRCRCRWGMGLFRNQWWGWIMLLVTWLVFVVGIGSSFGVWSWAWDVGETPYAPPELEDDPTLPIVGYYPALMVLTAVMAWVWVVVAWVGMKYFKHANIAADDG